MGQGKGEDGEHQDMSQDIERRVASACVTRLAARTYITTNSIPVRRYDDRSTVLGTIAAVVRTLPCMAVPSSNYKWLTLQFLAVSKTASDRESDAMMSLYADLIEEMQQTMTAALLTTSINYSKITINGFVPEEGLDEIDDGYFGFGCQQRVALTYTP
jgi:hypothetical protein